MQKQKLKRAAASAVLTPQPETLVTAHMAPKLQANRPFAELIRS